VSQQANGAANAPTTRRFQGGFTVVEIIVAMVILTIGVLGLAGTTGYIIRQITLSDLMTERAVAFQTIVDRLQSLPYDSVDAGTDTIGEYAVKWESTPNGSQNKTVMIVTQGPGMSTATGAPFNDPAAIDTFTFRILRR
jgi:prepilin-type N-terminal cleavage/methylation domain-containing protein